MKLQEVLRKIPNTFKYKGEDFRMVSYSQDTFANTERSNEIIYRNNKDTKEVYILGDNIEVIEVE